MRRLVLLLACLPAFAALPAGVATAQDPDDVVLNQDEAPPESTPDPSDGACGTGADAAYTGADPLLVALLGLALVSIVAGLRLTRPGSGRAAR